jgi:uncharacterized GH25 family protein
MSNPRSLPRRQTALVVMLSITFGAASLAAHDMWIDPTTFLPAFGDIVGIRLRVGEDLLGDPIPRDPTAINQFVVEDAEGRKPVVGRPGADPAGLVRASMPGMLVIGYRSNPAPVELPADKFNQYLKEEGLDAIAALRASRNQTGVPARELFSRCAKSLVLSKAGKAGPADRVLGFPLELVAERNPYELENGAELPVRLIYVDKPLAGALVVAISRSNPANKIAVRTNADGRVRLPLRAGGMWLIKAVHMVQAPSGSNADWESFWASLTFEAPGA